MLILYIFVFTSWLNLPLYINCKKNILVIVSLNVVKINKHMHRWKILIFLFVNCFHKNYHQNRIISKSFFENVSEFDFFILKVIFGSFQCVLSKRRRSALLSCEVKYIDFYTNKRMHNRKSYGFAIMSSLMSIKLLIDVFHVF